MCKILIAYLITRGILTIFGAILACLPMGAMIIAAAILVSRGKKIK